MSHPLPPPGPPGDDEPPYGALPGGQEPTPPGWGPPGGPYQPYGYPSPYVGVESHQGAQTGMILGIVSIAATVLGFALCIVLAPIGAVIGPFGIWKSARALKEIDAAPQRYNNRGQAVAGQVCSIIGTVLGALAVLGAIAVLAFLGIAIGSAP